MSVQESHANPTNSCWDIWVWTEVKWSLDQSGGPTPLSHAASMAEKNISNT